MHHSRGICGVEGTQRYLWAMCLVSGFSEYQILGRHSLCTGAAAQKSFRVSVADLRAGQICWFDIKMPKQMTNQIETPAAFRRI
jgi:hypothetical protein